MDADECSNRVGHFSSHDRVVDDVQDLAFRDRPKPLDLKPVRGPDRVVDSQDARVREHPRSRGSPHAATRARAGGPRRGAATRSRSRSRTSPSAAAPSPGRRFCRLRGERAPRGPRARDRLPEAPPLRRGPRDPRPPPRGHARRAAVRAHPDLRRLPVPGFRLRGAGPAQGTAGRGGARAPGRHARPRPPHDPGARPFHYRNKMEYSFGQDAEGRLTLGLHRRGFFDRLVRPRCAATSPRPISSEIVAFVRDAARREGSPRHDTRRHEGLLRYLVVREGMRTGR